MLEGFRFATKGKRKIRRKLGAQRGREEKKRGYHLLKKAALGALRATLANAWRETCNPTKGILISQTQMSSSQVSVAKIAAA